MKFNIYHIYLALGWGLYFFIHSFLATSRVKKYWQLNLGIGKQAYRLFYSSISSMGLIGLLLFNINTPSEFIIKNTVTAIIFGSILTGLGLFIIVTAFKYYNLKEFIGLKIERSTSLHKDGILKYIRHPLYLGTVLMVLGFWCFIPDYTTLITVTATFVYLPIGIWLEEKKLINTFGQDYLQYRQNVPGIIPRIRNS